MAAAGSDQGRTALPSSGLDLSKTPLEHHMPRGPLPPSSQWLQFENIPFEEPPPVHPPASWKDVLKQSSAPPAQCEVALWLPIEAKFEAALCLPSEAAPAASGTVVGESAGSASDYESTYKVSWRPLKMWENCWDKAVTFVMVLSLGARGHQHEAVVEALRLKLAKQVGLPLAEVLDDDVYAEGFWCDFHLYFKLKTMLIPEVSTNTWSPKPGWQDVTWT